MIEAEQITQAEFAERCDIKPATLSHVLTGRNSPSSQVIQKVLGANPQYRAEWLLKGEPPMMKEEYRQQQAREAGVPLFEDFRVPRYSVDQNLHPQVKETRIDLVNKEGLEKKETQTVIPDANTYAQTRKVVKIILYYDDNTFETFTPEPQ